MLYFLGIGSNLGNREQQINGAIRCLNVMGEMLGVAPFYYSKPQGFDSPNEFCNTVIALTTNLRPKQVLHLCQVTEREIGRNTHSIILPDGTKQYSDRLIDVDILCAYDDGMEITMNTPTLTLPHPRMQDRDFVLEPLKQLIRNSVKDTPIYFHKMHGLGNDYIYFDCIDRERQTTLLLLPLVQRIAPLLCERHTGVGADGLVFVLPDKKADVRMRIFNADGSEAEMCGNAARCVALFAFARKYAEGYSLKLATKGGIRKIVAKPKGLYAVAMGKPVYEGVHEIDGRTYHCVNVGNPHAITILKDSEALTGELVHTIGPQIESHPLFPNRTNVEFCVVLDDHHVAMRVWERGSGETQACGTGATATAVACIKQRLCKSPVTVTLLGGNLTIKHNSRITQMIGTATLAYTGVITSNLIEEI